MRRNEVPDNRLDIIVPVFKENVRLSKKHYAYPELTKVDRSEWKEKDEITLYPVSSDHRIIVRNAVEVIAYYFRREFDYDFPGYEAYGDNNRRDRIFVLTQGSYERVVVGVIVFRWREYTNAPHQLVLSWLWIHPFLRRKGILTSYWPIFRKLYGKFRIEQPLSKAMRAFLQKMGGPPLSDRTNESEYKKE